VALKFFTIPNTDNERIAIVTHLGAHGITCYLRLRGPPRDFGPGGFGNAVTLLVPEDQMHRAKQVLAAMVVASESEEPFSA